MKRKPVKYPGGKKPENGVPFCGVCGRHSYQCVCKPKPKLTRRTKG